MRFLCEAMLGGLARWLRAAKYDTLLAEGGWPDHTLIDLCVCDDRILLTKDRQLGLVARDTVRVLLLSHRSIDGNVRELREVLGVDWQHAPFTRCLIDNDLLRAEEPHHAEQVPLTSRSVASPLRMCPTCGRLYWPGGHVRRMQRRLASWQSRSPSAEEC